MKPEKIMGGWRSQAERRRAHAAMRQEMEAYHTAADTGSVPTTSTTVTVDTAGQAGMGTPRKGRSIKGAEQGRPGSQGDENQCEK